MTEYIVTVKDESKADFIWEHLNEFKYLKVEKRKKKLSAEDKRILDGIEESVQEVVLHRQGKIKMKTWDEFSDELKAEGFL